MIQNFNLFGITCPKVAIFLFLPKSEPNGPGWAWIQKKFIHTTRSYAEKFLEFALHISNICQNCHFCGQLKLQFSELNITPSVRPCNVSYSYVIQNPKSGKN